MATQQLFFHLFYQGKPPLPSFMRLYSPYDYPGKLLTRKRVVLGGIGLLAIGFMSTLKK